MDRKDFSGDGPHDIARIYNHKEAVEFLNVSVYCSANILKFDMCMKHLIKFIGISQ